MVRRSFDKAVVGSQTSQTFTSSNSCSEREPKLPKVNFSTDCNSFRYYIILNKISSIVATEAFSFPCKTLIGSAACKFFKNLGVLPDNVTKN